MSITSETLNSLVPITQFNKGQASRIFDRLKTEKQLIVLKNNSPAAVILSPEEYIKMSEIIEEHRLIMEAQARLKNNEGKKTLTFDEVMSACGVSENDIDNAEDLEIE